MPYTIVDPRDPSQDTNLPPPNIFQGAPPLPPVNPFRTSAATPTPTTGLNVPVGQVASTGPSSFWDFLRNLFSGHQGPAQGMTGLLARGRGGPSTDQLGNPLGRY